MAKTLPGVEPKSAKPSRPKILVFGAAPALAKHHWTWLLTSLLSFTLTPKAGRTSIITPKNSNPPALATSALNTEARILPP